MESQRDDPYVGYTKYDNVLVAVLDCSHWYPGKDEFIARMHLRFARLGVTGQVVCTHHMETDGYVARAVMPDGYDPIEVYEVGALDALYRLYFACREALEATNELDLDPAAVARSALKSLDSLAETATD